MDARGEFCESDAATKQNRAAPPDNSMNTHKQMLRPPLGSRRRGLFLFVANTQADFGARQ
jgi:hypothetical protein